MQNIELLSPARNLECGKAAVNHGADAVYLGASKFGARVDAGNSIEDIAELVQYAHQFGVKVYVTLNTILYDEELEEARRLIYKLYEAGVDALIVQDFALLKMELPPIPLHASTQTDNRTVDKVKALGSLGFRQVVLARELSITEISDIHKAVPDVTLEAFCHGALCVSYSGKCFASQYCFGRSANRGECSQFCRLPFALKDADGRQIPCGKYPLSLKDMNRSEHLEEMMDAGVRSFKIEGRLKDIAYVKNVTAYYRQRLDEIIQRRKEYTRASHGGVTLDFVPDLSHGFSRGYTDYFLHGRNDTFASMQTPKNKGQEVGRVKEVSRNSLVVAGTASFENGDGLCFFDEHGTLQGFRVNRADGNRVFPAKMPNVRKGDTLWRNFDQRWMRTMTKGTATRKVKVGFVLEDTESGFKISFVADNGKAGYACYEYAHEKAKSDQTQNIIDVFSKLGDTAFECVKVEIRMKGQWFVPRSVLANWRRNILKQAATTSECLQAERRIDTKNALPIDVTGTYQDNVANSLAREAYKEMGVDIKEPALEVQPTTAKPVVLMTCKYCVRHELGICPKQLNGKSEYREPLHLESKDGRRFRLKFDCGKCEMRVLNE